MKVLVADDTKNIRTLLTKCLELEGYEVKTANDGYEAREILFHERFDLAFIDIKMPALSGTEVIKSIRERGIRTPVIVITAYATVKNAVECTQMGAVAYLQKPFTADKVRTVLKESFHTRGTCERFGETLEDAGKLVGQSEFSKALPLLKELLASEPDNAEVYRLLGQTYEGLGNRENAVKFMEAHKVFSRP
jgi:DNA-binding NtrC family response regulator